jgi:hypothetical protein
MPVDEDPRATLSELTHVLSRHFGDDLLALYLFGSLASGGFRPRKSDLDLLAVLAADVRDVAGLEALHAAFVAERPAWTERIEVGYVSRAVLETLGGAPSGSIAVISPGEPMNVKDVGADWLLNWHGVCSGGEALVGPPPLELGPVVTPEAVRRAVEAQAAWCRAAVRASWVAYVPVQQGYLVVTLCRALYALETGGRTTKEGAVAWVAERYPEWASFVKEALAKHRAEVGEDQEATIRFADFAATQAGR